MSRVNGNQRHYHYNNNNVKNDQTTSKTTQQNNVFNNQNSQTSNVNRKHRHHQHNTTQQTNTAPVANTTTTPVANTNTTTPAANTNTTPEAQQQSGNFNANITALITQILAILLSMKQGTNNQPQTATNTTPAANTNTTPVTNTDTTPAANTNTTPVTNTNTTPATNTNTTPVANTNTNTNTNTSTTNKKVGPQDTNSDPIIQAKGKNYFVDSVNGSDSNDGSSPDKPLKTLSKINGAKFQPGDVINLARGSKFTGGLNITASGTADKPIIFRSYGTGNKPEISNSGNYSAAVALNNADHINLEGLKATGAMEDGFKVGKGSEYNVIKNCEATNVGIGIALRGENNIATQNYIHDLHLVVDTPGGDDDYGAVGAWLFASNNEISYNKMENLMGQSYDYGMDGGGCEVTGDVSNSKIIGNEITNTNGFMEFSQGTSNGVAANNIIADNVIKDFGDVFTCIHTTDHFAVNVKNLQMTNNTLINSADKLNNTNNLYNFCGSKLGDSDYILKDNKLIVG